MGERTVFVSELNRRRIPVPHDARAQAPDVNTRRAISGSDQHVASSGDYLSRFMIPALLGNPLGGVVLVALLNHVQVAASK